MSTLELHDDNERDVLCRALDAYIATKTLRAELAGDLADRELAEHRIATARRLGRRLRDL